MEWFCPHAGDIVGDDDIPVAVRRLPHLVPPVLDRFTARRSCRDGASPPPAADMGNEGNPGKGGEGEAGGVGRR